MSRGLHAFVLGAVVVTTTVTVPARATPSSRCIAAA